MIIMFVFTNLTNLKIIFIFFTNNLETPHSSNLMPLKKTLSNPNNSPGTPREKTLKEKTSTVNPSLPAYRQTDNSNANNTRENSFETTVTE